MIRIFLTQPYAYENRILVIDATDGTETDDKLILFKDCAPVAVIFKEYMIGYEWLEVEDDKN